MTIKHIFLGILGLLGMFMIGIVFLNESSPYVTIKEAIQSHIEDLHLAGEITPGTVRHLIKEKKIYFELIDQNKDKTTIEYNGMPPANFSDIKKVVAIGKFDKEHFIAKRLLIKCPSKYESQ